MAILPPKLFQFTPLREGRRKVQKRRVSIRLISIHAPPRGATPVCLLVVVDDKFQFTPLREGRRPCRRAPNDVGLFQFTPLREGRPVLIINANVSQAFQFTPLREGRPQGRCAFCAGGDFNSRPSARGDCHDGGYDAYEVISIHAPPRGATPRFR